MTAPETLIEIQNPIFREGYQIGRGYYFQKQSMLSDVYLVDCLRSTFQESTGVDEQYHTIGQFVGQMSGPVIPRQPHELSDAQIQKEAFLAEIEKRHGDADPTIADKIRQFWALQDDLAQKLTTTIFNQMLNHGI